MPYPFQAPQQAGVPGQDALKKVPGYSNASPAVQNGMVGASRQFGNVYRQPGKPQAIPSQGPGPARMAGLQRAPMPQGAGAMGGYQVEPQKMAPSTAQFANSTQAALGAPYPQQQGYGGGAPPPPPPPQQQQGFFNPFAGGVPWGGPPSVPGGPPTHPDAVYGKPVGLQAAADMGGQAAPQNLFAAGKLPLPQTVPTEGGGVALGGKPGTPQGDRVLGGYFDEMGAPVYALPSSKLGPSNIYGQNPQAWGDAGLAGTQAALGGLQQDIGQDYLNKALGASNIAYEQGLGKTLAANQAGEAAMGRLGSGASAAAMGQAQIDAATKKAMEQAGLYGEKAQLDLNRLGALGGVAKGAGALGMQGANLADTYGLNLSGQQFEQQMGWRDQMLSEQANMLALAKWMENSGYPPDFQQYMWNQMQGKLAGLNAVYGGVPEPETKTYF